MKRSISMAILVSTVVCWSDTTFTLDPSARRQTIQGWGTSLAWWANLAGGWRPGQIDTICHLIADTNQLNMNVYRFNIGGGDDPSHHHMRADGGAVPGYLDSAGGAYHWNRDTNQRRVLQKLVSLRPDAISQAIAYSAPWWMTPSGCSAGDTDGVDNLSDSMVPVFADYLTEIVKHYRDSLGIVFHTLEPMNEPDGNWCKWGGANEGTGYSFGKQEALVAAVYDALLKKRLYPRTKLAAMDACLIGDAIWAGQDYAKKGVLGKVSQIQTHSYGGYQFRSQLHGWAAANKLDVWMSESGAGGNGTVGSALVMAQRMFSDMKDIGAAVWCDWQVMSDRNANWGLINGNYPNQTFRLNKTFYVRMQTTRFLRQGYTVLATSPSNTFAAISPDSSRLAIVLINPDSTPNTFSLDLSRFPKANGAMAYRTTRTENCQRQSDLEVSKGILKYAMPDSSIATLVVPLRGMVVGVHQPPPNGVSIRTRVSGEYLQVSAGGAAETARLLDATGRILSQTILVGGEGSLKLPGNAVPIYLELMAKGASLGRSLVRLERKP